MDLKGSLVDTQLKIYPTESLLAFLINLKEDDIPPNILKLIGKDGKEPKESVTANIQLTSKDYDNLNKITEAVKDKFIINTAINNDNLDSDPKLMNDETDSKNFDEGIEVDGKTEKTANQSQDEILRKTPFRSTTDIDWLEDTKPSKETEDKIEEIIPKSPYLTTSDIDWLYNYLQKQKSNKKDVPYLHSLLAGANIEVPENRVIKRNPVLEARCVKLRKQQEAREYRKMTKTVDNVRLRFPEDSISYQMKQLNRQLIAIGQFIISIFAGFLFGFRGVEWMVGNLDFGFRLLLGVMCALVIALAEIYFLAKKLNEELSIPETVQLGGPPKFVDEAKYMNSVPTKKKIEKEHQD